jgi:hypothetical protein
VAVLVGLRGPGGLRLIDGPGHADPAPVPQHHQPDAEAQQEQDPRDDGDGGPGGLAGQVNAGRVQGVADGHRAHDEQQAHPHVGLGSPACGARGQHGGAGDDQHRVEHQRVEPGQPRSHPGLERDVVDAGIGEQEGGQGHQYHAGDDGGERGQPEPEMRIVRPGPTGDGIIAHQECLSFLRSRSWGFWCPPIVGIAGSVLRTMPPAAR